VLNYEFNTPLARFARHLPSSEGRKIGKCISPIYFKLSKNLLNAMIKILIILPPWKITTKNTGWGCLKSTAWERKGLKNFITILTQ